MANVLDREKQISVVHHLAEGNSIRATSRLTRVHRNTVMNLLTDFGPSCQIFMDLAFGNLHLEHIQIDEIWTFVGKKQGILTDKEKDEDPTIGDIYLFTALDEETKLVPAYVLGKRTKENACELADMLADRLVLSPGAQDDIQISTDGFPAIPTPSTPRSAGPRSTACWSSSTRIPKSAGTPLRAWPGRIARTYKTYPT